MVSTKKPDMVKGGNELIAGFWDPAEGPLSGVLVRKMNKGENPYYLFRVYDPTPIRTRTAGRETKRKAERGELIGCSASAGLNGIDSYVGHLLEIERGETKKVNPKTEREFWPFEWSRSRDPIAEPRRSIVDDFPGA